MALKELLRIGKSGYIEVPSFIAERILFGSSNHKLVFVSFHDIIGIFVSYRNVKSNHKLRFKVARLLDPFFNTCHTKMFWGKGKAIRFALKNESTGYNARKLGNFLE